MTSSQLFRVSGLALLVGAIVFVAHVVARSIVTAGPDAATFAREAVWVPINALGVAGATLVLLGLPAMYVRMAGASGVLGFVGVVLLASSWIFLGVFLSLYGALLAPWLAEKAPSLLAASTPLPFALIATFTAALVAQLIGTVLLAVPFIRGRARPRWVGAVLPASAIAAILGNLVAPTGPAANVAVNLLSNLGPMLLVAALGSVGFRMWSETASNGDGSTATHT